jgi:hypothetical protein
VDSKANDATRVLIHDEQYSTRFQPYRLAAEQIRAQHMKTPLCYVDA